MALLDLIANPANLSTVIEFMSLVGVIFLFFRKLNEDNTKQIDSVKENLAHATNDLRGRVQDSETILYQRVTEVKLEVDKLRDNLYTYMTSSSGNRSSRSISSDPLHYLNRERDMNNNNNNNENNENNHQ